MNTSTKPRHLELARKIIGFALDSDYRDGARLAESHLAVACDVSRTPVRAALKLLEQQGLVRKSQRGGYVLVGNPAGAADLIGAGPDNAERALADEIHRDRAGRRLAEKVTASDLMRRYGASRKLVLKSLDVLQEQGVISRAAGQAWVFSRTLADAAMRRQSYEFRIIMEPQAILAQGFRLDANRAAMVRRQTQGLLSQPENSIGAGAFQKADIAFHQLIAGSSGNSFLAGALQAHHRLRQLPGTAARMSDYRQRQALEEHLRMLAHLNRDQYEIAADLMRLHLRVSGDHRPRVANRGAPALVRPIESPDGAGRGG